MKTWKKKAVITAGTLVAAGVFTTGCVRPTVYGPPPERPNSSPSFSPESNIPEVVYGPPEEMLRPGFSPEVNIPEDVYGPPIPYEDEESEAPEESVPDVTEETYEDR